MRMDFKMQTDAPSFSRGRHRRNFQTMAAGEIALLCMLVLLFIRYQSQVDVIELSAALMVVLAAGSWMVRHSVFLAQIVLLLCLLSLEAMLVVEPLFHAIPVLGLFTITPEYIIAFFLLLDAGVLWFFVMRGSEDEDESEEKKFVIPPPPRDDYLG